MLQMVVSGILLLDACRRQPHAAQTEMDDGLGKRGTVLDVDEIIHRPAGEGVGPPVGTAGRSLRPPCRSNKSSVGLSVRKHEMIPSQKSVERWADGCNKPALQPQILKTPDHIGVRLTIESTNRCDPE